MSFYAHLNIVPEYKILLHCKNFGRKKEHKDINKTHTLFYPPRDN